MSLQSLWQALLDERPSKPPPFIRKLLPRRHTTPHPWERAIRAKAKRAGTVNGPPSVTLPRQNGYRHPFRRRWRILRNRDNRSGEPLTIPGCMRKDVRHTPLRKVAIIPPHQHRIRCIAARTGCFHVGPHAQGNLPECFGRCRCNSRHCQQC